MSRWLRLCSEIPSAKNDDISGDMSNLAIQETIQSGNVIVASLNEYKREHGYYPESLEILTDQKASSSTHPIAGSRKWRYSVMQDGENFMLSFGSGPDHYPGYYYSSEANKWKSDY